MFKAHLSSVKSREKFLEVVLLFWKKLGEESFHSLGNSKHQFTERGCALKENTFQLDSDAQELSDLENSWASDPRDYIQRYVVRSSDCIAKLRDMKPGQLAFYYEFP